MTSTYVQISKRIGWDSHFVTIPNQEQVEQLEKSAETGDVSAFEKLFEIVRFGAPSNQDELDCTNAAYRAFSAVKPLFK